MMVLFASLLLASSTAAADLSAGSVIPSDATATQLVESCRTMIPRDIELKGRLILRNRRGITQAEHDYVLTRADVAGRRRRGTDAACGERGRVVRFVAGDGRDLE